MCVSVCTLQAEPLDLTAVLGDLSTPSTRGRWQVGSHQCQVTFLVILGPCIASIVKDPKIRLTVSFS